MINFVNVIEKYEMVISYIPDVINSKHEIRDEIFKIFKDEKNKHELYLDSIQWENVKLNKAIDNVKMIMRYFNTLTDKSLENMLKGKSINKFFNDVCQYYTLPELNIANIVPNNKFTENLFLYLNELVEGNIIQDMNLKGIYDWQLSNYVIAIYPTIKQIFIDNFPNCNALKSIIKVCRQLPSSVIPKFESIDEIISFFQILVKLTPWYLEKNITIQCNDFKTLQILSELSIEFESSDSTALNLFLSKVGRLGFSIEKVREIYQNKKSIFIEDVINLKGHYFAELTEIETSRYIQNNISLTEIVYGKKSYKVMVSVNEYLKGLSGYYFSSQEEKLKNEDRLFRFFARIKNIKGAINFFEKAVLNSNEDLKNMIMFSPLYSEFVIKNVSINNLNDKTFKKMVDMGYYEWSSLYPRLDKEDLPSKITPEEYFVYRDLNTFCKQIYKLLILNDTKVDVRLRAIQSITSVNVDLLKELLIPLFGNEEDFKSIFIQKASVLFKNTQSIHFANKYPSMDTTYAFLCFVLETISENFAECQSNGDVKVMLYAMSTVETFKQMSLEEAKTYFYENHNDMNEARIFLDLSDSFYIEHRESIANFVLNGNFNIVKTHYNNTIQNNYISNIKLLAKAEIAGRLKEIRLSKQGLERELNTTINNSIYDTWKNDMVINHNKKDRVVYENSNFQDFMLYGVYPQDSCMNYVDGEYAHCMLSIFDSNKKLLYIKQRGVIIGRAILRFTKYTTDSNKAIDNLESKLDGLQFNDVDGVHVSEKINHISAVFLERLYTSVDNNLEGEIKELMVDLALQKAKDMGVKLITSKDYEDVLMSKSTNTEDLYVYISKSKNGNQYLDSLDGYAQENKGGSFVSVTLPLVDFN